MKKRGRILIVDDKEELLLTFKYFLSGHFETIDTLRDPNQIPSLLSGPGYDVILLDMNFSAGISSGNEGLYWLKRIREADRDVEVVFITAFGDVDLAVKAMKEGAADFIQKSWDEKKMLSTIMAAYRLHQSKLEIKKLKNQKQQLSNELRRDFKVCRMKSHSMKHVYDTIDKIKDTDASVLILGENGTGKEIIAREIHWASSRRDELFVSVDLGSLSENLLESELFGHVKGAFTDAASDRKGRFELASGGTLFLDEIGNLPVHMQTRLLSAIQNRQIIRVGSNQPVAVDIRLICATNTPIHQKIDAGEFREDLFYRINTIQLELPPLRDRMVDIPILAEYFLHHYADKYRKPGIGISPSAIELLKKHSWPGNIRELQHVIEKAVILAGSKNIGPHDISVSDRNSFRHIPLDNFNLYDHEKRIIGLVLSKYRWNIRQSALKLGIDRTTLYSKIRKYGIQKT
jgi:two-component system response regulator HydG